MQIILGKIIPYALCVHKHMNLAGAHTERRRSDSSPLSPSLQKPLSYEQGKDRTEEWGGKEAEGEFYLSKKAKELYFSEYYLNIIIETSSIPFGNGLLLLPTEATRVFATDVKWDR